MPATALQRGVHLQIETMAAGKDTTLLINPQWRGGQVISDFGLFFRKQKEEFVASFTPVYSVTPKRVSEMNIWCVCSATAALHSIKSCRHGSTGSLQPDLHVLTSLNSCE